MKYLWAIDYHRHASREQRETLRQWVESLPGRGCKLRAIGFGGELFTGLYATSPGGDVEERPFIEPPHPVMCELVRLHGRPA